MIDLFGTDGIRGKAGIFPFDLKNLSKIALSYARYLKDNSIGSIIIGYDTRISASYIHNTLCGILNYHGINTISAGILTTPGIAFFCKYYKMPGIMVSASHNPYYDNGLKFFDIYGNKADREFEHFIERIYNQECWSDLPVNTAEFGILSRLNDYYPYFDHIQSILKNMSLKDRPSNQKYRILFDLANGGAVSIKEIFDRFSNSFQYDLINYKHNGVNINIDCGSEHIRKLIQYKDEYDLIIAFDGDADRVYIMDSQGFVYNGDMIMIFILLYLKEYGENSRKTAGTIMTSLSAEKIIKASGYELLRSDIGDRNLKNIMDRYHISIGAESSGHIIFRDHLPTGDGLFIALLFIHIFHLPYIQDIKNDIISEYESTAKVMQSFPLREKIHINELYSVFKKYLSDEKMELINNSVVIRIKDDFYSVIRLSGTEAKIRIYAESADKLDMEKFYNKALEILTDNNLIISK